MKVEWVDNFKIKVRQEDGATVISANREGLLSLAKQLETLAKEGGHYHLDEHNSLEEGSTELIIEKIN